MPADFFPLKPPPDDEIAIDYVVFSYSLVPTTIKNLTEAQKDFKFLTKEDKNKQFWYTYIFNRVIAKQVIYTAVLSLFERKNEILSYDKNDGRVFKLYEEKEAFQFFARLKDLFLPCQRAEFLYKGFARKQEDIDQMLIKWSAGLKDLIK